MQYDQAVCYKSNYPNSFPVLGSALSGNLVLCSIVEVVKVVRKVLGLGKGDRGAAVQEKIGHEHVGRWNDHP